MEFKILSETFVTVELYHLVETFFLKMTYFIQMLYLWWLENLWWRLMMVKYPLKKKFNGGNQRSHNTIELLDTQPTEILQGWWRMLVNRNGRFEKFWSTSALLVLHSNLVEQVRAIPPASTSPMYKAWQAVAMDTAEWLIPGTKKKLKFLHMMDLATKLRVAHVIKEYDNMTMEAENAEDIITGFSEKWLSILPKPDLVVLDSSKTFTSEKLREFLININVQVHIIAEKEPWANGVVEAAIQDIKNVASAIQLENLPQVPSVTLFLATSALNSTEYTAGFSSFQWAYGKQYTLRDEDYRTFQQIPPGVDFQNLVQSRQLAEEIAVKTKAKRTLSKLANTTVRQPLRTFNPMDLVKVWRKLQPSDQYKGVRGGHKKAGRPQWIGPGRVIFQEVLPHQPEGDHRRHIIWVLIGNRVMRCSVHSVRLCTEPERLQHDLTADEDPTSWKTLADILPKREFTDMVDQAPSAEDLELPDLPAEPDESTLIPIRRAHSKQTYGPQDFRRIHRSSPLGVRPDPQAPQHYDRPQPSAPSGSSPVDLPSGAQPGYYSPSIAPASPPPFDDEDDGLDKQLGINDYGPTTTPSSKKPRLEYNLKWVEQLEQGAQEEAMELDFMTVLEEQDECLLFNINLEFESNRQLKKFERNPVSYLVKKINSSEVNLKRLTPDELDLFKRAKNKEVDSFIKNEAVRRCLDSKEVAEAYNSNRILKARWVLTWKNIPPDEKEEALLDRQQNSNTTVNQQATKKAKARIVLLGYQHPSLLDRGFKTSAPVQSTLGRNLLYVLATTHQWELNGLDLATAFLQTQPTEADSRLWTTGVEELREALGVPHDSVLRILRNIYGSTTAPRGLWLDLHRTLTSLDGVAALGERCLWLWFSKTELDSTGQFPRLIGAMGGHVDDFHRVGDVNSAEWMATCEKIDKAYKWGTVKRRSYRHAGTDISTIDTPNGFKIVVDQDAYVESLPDLQISRERLRADGPLSDDEKKDSAEQLLVVCNGWRFRLNPSYALGATSFSLRLPPMELCNMPVKSKAWSVKFEPNLNGFISSVCRRWSTGINWFSSLWEIKLMLTVPMVIALEALFRWLLDLSLSMEQSAPWCWLPGVVGSYAGKQ